MISYGKIEEKDDDDPDPAYLHPCGSYELRNDKSAGDGLNGSISLDKGDLSAVGAEKGDRVKVYAEANGRWILYERSTYGDRYGIGMPIDHREKLGLNSGDRTVEIWLDEADEQGQNLSPSRSDATERYTQIPLENGDNKQKEYVLLLDDNPVKYHHVTERGGVKTECGINFNGQNIRRFSDPGDALDQCSDCAIRSSEDMTNKQLVDWLGDQAGFESDEGTPAYLSKEQLVALRDYILDIQEKLPEETDSNSRGDDGGDS